MPQAPGPLRQRCWWPRGRQQPGPAACALRPRPPRALGQACPALQGRYGAAAGLLLPRRRAPSPPPPEVCAGCAGPAVIVLLGWGWVSGLMCVGGGGGGSLMPARRNPKGHQLLLAQMQVGWRRGCQLPAGHDAAAQQGGRPVPACPSPCAVGRPCVSASAAPGAWSACGQQRHAATRFMGIVRQCPGAVGRAMMPPTCPPWAKARVPPPPCNLQTPTRPRCACQGPRHPCQPPPAVPHTSTQGTHLLTPS